MERRRGPSRFLPRSSLSKSPRPGHRTISSPAGNRKATHTSRARVPSKRGIAPKASQPVLPCSQLQQHYAFSFQITTDQKESWMSQASVEKAVCTSCTSFAAGRIVLGGFVCEECIRIFIIQNQLWRLPVMERNSVVYDEVLKHAV